MAIVFFIILTVVSFLSNQNELNDITTLHTFPLSIIIKLKWRQIFKDNLMCVCRYIELVTERKKKSYCI